MSKSNVYDPTPRLYITMEAGATQYIVNIHVLSGNLKCRGSLTALYIHISIELQSIITLIRYHMAYLPIFFICMNNSIHWLINKFLQF